MDIIDKYVQAFEFAVLSFQLVNLLHELPHVVFLISQSLASLNILVHNLHNHLLRAI